MNIAEPAGVAVILAQLRAELKRRGIPVAQLAARMGVAEPTAWRWLRGTGLTLANLGRICTLLDIDLRDLIERGYDDGLSQFTLRQERMLAADRELALVFFVILNGAQRDVLEGDFGIAGERLDRLLERLRRLGLISLTARGRLRPLASRSVRWRQGGPLAHAFDATVKSFFLGMDFGADDALYVSDMVRLSAAGRARVMAAFEALRDDVHVIARQDRVAPGDRADWAALFMLVRPLDIAEITSDLG